MLEFVLWGAIALIVYVYVGYPALVAALARRRARPAPGPWHGEPPVTVVVVAYNEEERIAARVRNLLALDYPRDRLEVIVASDGSSDATVQHACQVDHLGMLRVVAFAERRGKAAVLNDVVPMARGTIVVLADARQRFDGDALRALVAPFAHPRVGAVSGELMLTDDPDADRRVARGVGLYWRYEKFIRRAESGLDSSVGATGAIYALRKVLFAPIPVTTILDDVLIPMQVARRGYRVVFEPRALAWDRVAPTADGEFRRKTRTLAGNFQLFARHHWLLDPRQNRLWFQTMSHKALRLAVPLLLGVVLAASLALAAAGSLVALALVAAQAAFYALGFAGAAAARLGRRAGAAAVPFTFCLLNWAVVVGLWRYLTARQAVTWERGDTIAPAPAAPVPVAASSLWARLPGRRRREASAAE
jgi:biofilm PGA synthesis N-glycosyltransferase PgaC